ncbi:TetR/AcrR family transcriptional regulator [Pelagibius litoralis]|uniref:TetR/AcrR family transcriptional regulator n=1 Tax=Pelagibius litoralis TaxID=374515 RepID=A0A967EWS9_9PROT|nr:TetR/AcrR family transcriptional regulator [Pelagibius litoralis]NIA68178.1 TetR/AcrR family transcriptional regulator [Pelagibius litoralis]
MARPSVTAERREEILAAFARCVARDGVEGASLQQVADAAGLARALLRHHIGNREDMILALAERFCRQSMAEMDALVELLPKKKRLEKLIAVLFTTTYASSSQELQVAAALINAAASRPALKKMLRHWYDGFEDVIALELQTAYPAAKRAAVAEVATAIVGMAFSVDSLTPLGKVDDLFQRSQRAALRLAATLGN